MGLVIAIEHEGKALVLLDGAIKTTGPGMAFVVICSSSLHVRT